MNMLRQITGLSIIHYVFGFLMLGCSPAVAEERPFSCVQDIGVPRFIGFDQGLPGTFDVSVRVGANGKAESVLVVPQVRWMKAEFDHAFGANAQYLAACSGQTLHFVVRYVVEGAATDKIISVTTFRMPNEFRIVFRPMVMSVN